MIYCRSLEHIVPLKTLTVMFPTSSLMPMDLATCHILFPQIPIQEHFRRTTCCAIKSFSHHGQESSFRYRMAPPFGLYRLACCWLLRWDLDLLAGTSHSKKKKSIDEHRIERLVSCIRSFLSFQQILTPSLALYFIIIDLNALNHYYNSRLKLALTLSSKLPRFWKSSSLGPVAAARRS
jgi:hypothetical protein